MARHHAQRSGATATAPQPFAKLIVSSSSAPYESARLAVASCQLPLTSKLASAVAMIASVTNAGLLFGGDGGNETSSSSGGNSPRSGSRSTSDSEEGSSSNADEEWRDFRQVSESSACALDDIGMHQQRMLLLLPAFSSSTTSSSGARTDALSRWLTGFDVGWVLDMGASSSTSAQGQGQSLPRREVGRRVRAWAHALSTMERVFRQRHRELTDAQVAALGELAAATSGAMLRLPDAVAALGSSPSKLLAALDVYVPLSEAFPVLARMFTWGPAHPASAAAEAALAGLVDAARRCARDLGAFVRSHYPWRMPQGGEVHPCVGFWMGYFRCMLRNRFTLYFVLGDEDGLGLVAELIACLEAVLEEKSAALAFPGLRPVFMLNNTFAIVRRAVRSDLKLFLPPEWSRVREERMEGYIKGYVEASWAPVVSRLDCGGGAKPPTTTVLRRRSNRLSSFYSALENACSAQRAWKVPNPVLRGILRKTVSDNVVPVYRRYLKDHPEVEVAKDRTADELERQLWDLFEG